MIKRVVAIYDTKANVFFAPGVFNTIGEAVRGFSDAVNDKQSGNLLSKHPKDFLLFEIAAYDDSGAVYENVTPHKRLGIGSDFVLEESNGVPKVLPRMPVSPEVSHGS